MTNIKSLLLLISAVAILSSCNNNGEHDESTETQEEQVSDKPAPPDQEEPISPDKPYPYESGKITYKYEGDYEGEQVIYFTDYGNRFRVEEQYVNKAAPFKDTVNQVFIYTPDMYYFVDLKQSTGYKVSNEEEESEAIRGNLLPDFGKMGIDSAMRKNGFEKSGTREIEGKQCVVYSSEDGSSQFCFWKGINVRTEMALGEQFKYSLRAVEIDEKAKVADNKFDPPQGIRFLEYDTYIEEVTKNKR